MGLMGRPYLEVRKRVVKEGGAVECHCVGDLIGNLAAGRRQRGVRGRCHVRGRNSNYQPDTSNRLIDFKCTCNVGYENGCQKSRPIKIAN